MVVRIVILLAIMGAVFSMGVKVGEFKADFGARFGGTAYERGMMGGYGNRSYRMMAPQYYYQYDGQNAAPAVPESGTATQ
jgi:hypothetical protein